MRYPLPYAFARSHQLLLEDDGKQLVLWAGDKTPASALAEVTRLFEVDTFERESSDSLTQRISVVYAGGESSAAAVAVHLVLLADIKGSPDHLSLQCQSLKAP